MTSAGSERLPMRAVVLHGVGDLRLESVARPVAASDGVLVRVASCGVCGSDIPRIFEKGTYSFPTICGHEFAGTVEAVGSAVQDHRRGDRVAVFPLLWCGRCQACEDGAYAQCADYDYLGSRSDGAFAELVAAPARNLIRIPEGVTLEEGSLIEPAAVALHALEQGGGARVGETVAVFGAGPIGIMLAQWARAMGARRVLLFDVVAAKLELARSLGFESVHDATRTDPVRAVLDATDGQGAHLSIEGAGVPVTLRQAIEVTRRAGRIVVMGNPSADVTLPASLVSTFLRRELTMRGTWNSRYRAAGGDDDWRTALDAIARGVIDVRPLVTHRYPLDGAIEGLERMRRGQEFHAKVLVQPERPGG